MRLCQPGHFERLKLAVHAVAALTGGAMAIYNAAAWLERREPHHAVNAILYTAFTGYEIPHVQHHYRAIRAADAPAPSRGCAPGLHAL